MRGGDLLESCLEHSAHERAIRTHDGRLDAHGGEIDELRECVVRLTALQEAHTKWEEAHAAWQADADERIAALESAPAKRWETVSNYVLTAAVAFVVGIVATHLGINI